jgi:hypothetical protein
MRNRIHVGERFAGNAADHDPAVLQHQIFPVRFEMSRRDVAQFDA